MATNPPWKNKHNMSDIFVSDLIEGNFPEIKVESVSKIGEGWDNTTWLVNNLWSFRLPKHELAATLIQNEIRLLPILPELGVAYPRPIFIAKASKNYPYPFYGHVFLFGETADKCCLLNHERALLAEPIAQFLKNLHAINIDEMRGLGVSADHLQRLNPMARFKELEERINYLSTQELVKDILFFYEFCKKYKSVQVPKDLVLAHGDFYAKHLILNKDKKLHAVIDWGDSELINPAVDLAIVYLFLPKASHQRFWTIYGSVDEQIHLLARLRAVFSLVTQCWYSHKVSDHHLFQESLAGFELLRENIF